MCKTLQTVWLPIAKSQTREALGDKLKESLVRGADQQGRFASRFQR
jgi:hypothetical protein